MRTERTQARGREDKRSETQLDGCIHSFSSERAQLVKIVNRERIATELLGDVRCKSGKWIRHQTSKKNGAYR